MFGLSSWIGDRFGAAWNVAMNTIYYRMVPDRLIGRVSSVGALAAFGALPLGSLAGGVLLQVGGPARHGETIHGQCS